MSYRLSTSYWERDTSVNWTFRSHTLFEDKGFSWLQVAPCLWHRSETSHPPHRLGQSWYSGHGQIYSEDLGSRSPCVFDRRQLIRTCLGMPFQRPMNNFDKQLVVSWHTWQSSPIYQHQHRFSCWLWFHTGRTSPLVCLRKATGNSRKQCSLTSVGWLKTDYWLISLTVCLAN